jgi:hypothetical protein
MTTQTVHIQTYDYGASLTSATLRAISTDALVATADTTDEVTADSGLYAVVFDEVTAIAAGTYRLRAVAGGQPINRYVTLAGVDAEVVQSRSERFAELSPNGITAAVLAADAVNEIADGVWDEATAGHTASGTYGGRIVRSTNSNVEVQITGSNHVAADVHEFQAGVIVAGAFAANSLTAAALAADAVTEIQSGLATSSQITALNNITAASVVTAMGTGTFLTAVPWNAAWDAEVQSEMQDAIEVNHLDHLLAADYDPASKPGSATALLNELIGNDAGVSRFTANALELAPGGGSGGDATLAKQEQILAAIQGSEVIQVASPNVLGNLVLTQGDSYDGIANPKAQWTVTTDYTDGWAVALTIRDEDDAVIYTTAGTVVSPTVIAVAIAAPTGLTMAGCPGQWQGKFDVELTKAGSKKTIALGTCYINEDQTR